MTTATKTKKQKIAFAATCVFPAGILLLSAMLLLGDTVPNRTFLVGYFVLPVLVIFLLKLTVFSQRKVWTKVFLCILLLFFLTVGFFFITTVGRMEMDTRYQNEEVADNYADIDTRYPGMPSLDEVGTPEELTYVDYFSQQMVFFDVDVKALKCTYEASEYAEEKASLEERYFFQAEPVSADGHMVEPTLRMDGYTFRMLSFGGEYEDVFFYPKSIMFVATNDTANEIVYLYFVDADLDYIVDLSDFILYDCGWRQIRK